MLAQRVLALAVIFICSTLEVSASLKVDTFSKESPAAVAQLECVGFKRGERIVSLAGVLATNLKSIPDIVLVAAHGLGANLDGCYVTFKGNRLGISRMERGQGGDVHGDWAVLTLNGRFPEPIHRLRWDAQSANDWELFALRGGRVSMLKFVNGETGRSCNIRVPRGGMIDPTDGNAIVLSDCISIPGMSGAPALVEIDGLPTIMGLNIGTRYDLSGSSSAWRSRANLIRLVDTSVEDAIVRAIASAGR